jgi:hypothetical protein
MESRLRMKQALLISILLPLVIHGCEKIVPDAKGDESTKGVVLVREADHCKVYKFHDENEWRYFWRCD